MSSPDRFALCSGGRDSAVSTHKLMEETADERKEPIVVYLDTGIGIEENHEYVKEWCDAEGWQLWTLRTNESYEDLVKEYGFPGPSKHTMFYAALKERQLQRLSSRVENPHFHTGIRAGESRRRMGNAEREHEQLGAVWHSDIIDWTHEEVLQYIEEHDIPENPLWDKGHFKDCGCGAYGSPEELLEVQADYPEMYQRLTDLENAVDRDDEYGRWGWGQMSEAELRQVRAENDEQQMTLCSMCGIPKSD